MSEQPILWLDLETTGLNPDKCHILEVAAVLTNKDAFKMYKSYSSVIEGGMNGYWESYPLKMHKESGLIDALSDKDGSTLEYVRDKILKLIHDHCPNHKPYLGGRSVHFDRSFLKCKMPALEEKLHYRNLDVTSIQCAVEAAKGGSISVGSPSSHRAMDDIKQTIEQYRELLGEITLRR